MTKSHDEYEHHSKTQMYISTCQTTITKSLLDVAFHLPVHGVGPTAGDRVLAMRTEKGDD